MHKKAPPSSINPVIEYIMNMFSEPFSSPTNSNYSTISLLLARFINQEISYENCYKAIEKITQDCKPLNKLKSILDTPLQPLPSDSNLYTSSQNYPHLGFDDHDQFSSVCSSKKKFQNWSNVEDERLLCGIIRFGFDNWTTIAMFVGNNRTRSQCNQRWARGLDPHISRDQWTPEESEKLLQLVQIHGEKSWTHIASLIGNRSDVQCRYHYIQLTKRPRSNSYSTEMANNPSNSLNQANVNMPSCAYPNTFPSTYIPPYLDQSNPLHIYGQNAFPQSNAVPLMQSTSLQMSTCQLPQQMCPNPTTNILPTTPPSTGMNFLPQTQFSRSPPSVGINFNPQSQFSRSPPSAGINFNPQAQFPSNSSSSSINYSHQSQYSNQMRQQGHPPFPQIQTKKDVFNKPNVDQSNQQGNSLPAELNVPVQSNQGDSNQDMNLDSGFQEFTDENESWYVDGFKNFDDSYESNGNDYIF